MCQYAKDLGMETVGHCPDGKCVYVQRFKTKRPCRIKTEIPLDQNVETEYISGSIIPTSLIQ